MAATASKVDILESIRDLADDLGKTPTAAEFTALTDHSHVAAINRCGSWNAAIDDAGLERNKRGPDPSD